MVKQYHGSKSCCRCSAIGMYYVNGNITCLFHYNYPSDGEKYLDLLEYLEDKTGLIEDDLINGPILDQFEKQIVELRSLGEV